MWGHTCVRALVLASLTVPTACRAPPDDRPDAVVPGLTGLFEFVKRLDAQSRLFHDDTGRWPRRASDLPPTSLAALEPIPLHLDLGQTLIHPKANGRLALELRPKDDGEGLYLSVQGDDIRQESASAVRDE